jgi:hypothetical protein
MSSRRRNLPRTENGGEETETKRRAPELDIWNFLPEEAISRIFDPSRVLRRVFFFDEKKSKYVLIGFYPACDYQVLVEFGGQRSKPIALTEQHLSTLAENLPRICEAIYGGEQNSCKDDIFRLNTTGSYRVARMYLDKQYISLKLTELQYLTNILHVVRKEQSLYFIALPNVVAYATAAMSSTVYVAPAPNAST